MKKFLMVLMAILFGSVVYASIVPDCVSTTAVPLIQEKIISTIDGIAAGLQVGAEKLWVVMLKQARVYAVSMVIYLVLFIVLCFIYWKALSIFWIKSANDDSCTIFERLDSSLQGVSIAGLAVFGIVLFVCTLCLIFSIGSIITATINPEYWVIQEIMQTLTNVN